MKHYSVLKKESIDALNIHDDGIYVDATLGYAGDSQEILKRIKKGFLFAFDRDLQAIQYSDTLLDRISNHYQLIHSDFTNMKEELAKRDIHEVDGILFDLGVSSPQLDENRGFSFMRDEKLDMRMNQEDSMDAAYVVNHYSENDLKRIFYDYGEEKKSSVIAHHIVVKRKEKEIQTTQELVQCILESVGANYFYKNHPERKIFQAIRIEVNHELSDLESVLPEAISLLKKDGRLVVITFHSLEDRIVKKAFKQYSEVNPIVKGLPNIPDEYKPMIHVMNHKPILPSEEELKENKRSASAKLRIVERI